MIDDYNYLKKFKILVNIQFKVLTLNLKLYIVLVKMLIFKIFKTVTTVLLTLK